MVEGGARAPQSEVSGVFGHQTLSQEDKTGHRGRKICPACFFLTHYVVLSSSDNSTSWNEKVKIKSLTLEQFHSGETKMKFSGRKGR